MKKSLIKNLMALSFALGAMVFIGGNVFANHNEDDEFDDGDGNNTSTKYCSFPGGSAWHFAYSCDDPGYHTLPPYKCGGIMIKRVGKILEQCW